jgi:hypothetical protein
VRSRAAARALRALGIKANAKPPVPGLGDLLRAEHDG